MQDHQIISSQHLNRVINLRQGAHAGRQDDWFFGRTNMPQQMIVGQTGRGNLVAWNGEFFQKVDRCFVPRRCKPSYSAFFAVGVDLAILFLAELQCALEITIGARFGASVRIGRGKIASRFEFVGKGLFLVRSDIGYSHYSG